MAKTLAQLKAQVRELVGDYQETIYTDDAIIEAINWAQDLIIRRKGLKVGKRIYPVAQYPTGQFPPDLLSVKRMQLILLDDGGGTVTTTYTVTFNSSLVGSVLNGDTSQQVLEGESTTAVEAVAPDGYTFWNWTVGGDTYSTDNPLVVTNVLADMTVDANYAAETFLIEFVSAGNGIITGDASQTVEYNGSTTSVTAVADEGYTFNNWTVDGVNVGYSATITRSGITSSQVVTAHFNPNTFLIEFVSAGNGSLSGDTSQTVAYGADTTPVTAVPDEGYVFDNWTVEGVEISVDNPVTLPQNTSPLTVTANFSVAPVEFVIGYYMDKLGAVAKTPISLGSSDSPMSPQLWDANTYEGETEVSNTPAGSYFVVNNTDALTVSIAPVGMYQEDIPAGWEDTAGGILYKYKWDGIPTNGTAYLNEASVLGMGLEGPWQFFGCSLTPASWLGDPMDSRGYRYILDAGLSGSETAFYITFNQAMFESAVNGENLYDAMNMSVAADVTITHASGYNVTRRINFQWWCGTYTPPAVHTLIDGTRAQTQRIELLIGEAPGGTDVYPQDAFDGYTWFGQQGVYNQASKFGMLCIPETSTAELWYVGDYYGTNEEYLEHRVYWRNDWGDSGYIDMDVSSWVGDFAICQQVTDSEIWGNALNNLNNGEIGFQVKQLDPGLIYDFFGYATLDSHGCFSNGNATRLYFGIKPAVKVTSGAEEYNLRFMCNHYVNLPR